MGGVSKGAKRAGLGKGAGGDVLGSLSELISSKGASEVLAGLFD